MQMEGCDPSSSQRRVLLIGATNRPEVGGWVGGAGGLGGFGGCLGGWGGLHAEENPGQGGSARGRAHTLLSCASLLLGCYHPPSRSPHCLPFTLIPPLVQELDEAARRRMPKQLYIPLPCSEARRAMIERQLGSGASVAAQLSPTDLNKIVAKTDGYSGSDMRNLIQEACQGPVRDAVARLGNRVAELNSSDLRPVSGGWYAVGFCSTCTCVWLGN